jgi:hypothetical protein
LTVRHRTATAREPRRAAGIGRRVGALLVGLTTVAALCCGVGSAWAETRVVVIVAAGSTNPSMSLDELALIYRRKKQFVGPARVQPINLPAQHPLRRFFSQQVLHNSPEDLEDYWRDMYFNGVSPPFVLASEEAVIRFVASTPGAVGYVSQCAVDRRVSVVAVLDGGPPCAK